MGVEVFIVAENLPLEIQDGKSLAMALDDLDSLTKELGLTLLSEFIMTDIETHCSLYFDAPDELRDSETNEYDEAAVSVWLKENDYPPIPPYLWFAPEEGLKTITGLLAHLSANPGCIEFATDAQDALDRCRETLEELAITHARWHFEVTF